ncbi:Ig-like domain-containing protein [Enterocloster citroniae]
MKRHWKRALSVFLSVAMLFSMTGTNTALAVERDTPPGANGLCEHHPVHTDACGYAGGTRGTPCGHEHSDECWKEVTKCVHKHTDDCYDEETDLASGSNAKEPVNCSHICDEESGCMTQALDCSHEHDEDCGYIAGGPGTPCAFVCEECDEEDQVNGGGSGGLSRGDSVGLAMLSDGGVIAAFDALSYNVLYQSYNFGEIEAPDDLTLPDTLTGVNEDEEEITIKDVTWQSEPAFDPEDPGEYTFSPVLPEGYTVADGVDLPEILVTIQWNNAGSDASIIAAIEAYNQSHAENGGTGEFSVSGGITGTVTGATETFELEIPAGVKVVWQANFSGNIADSPMVSLTGDGAFEVNDYCIFGRGSVLEVGGNVTFTGITGDGVVVAWDNAGSGPYTEGSTTDLTAWSNIDNAVTVQWALKDGESGIRYTNANGSLTDFLAVEGVTVTADSPGGSTQLAENGLLTLSDTDPIDSYYDSEGWKWDGSALTLKSPGIQQVNAVNFDTAITGGATVKLESDVTLDTTEFTEQPTIWYKGGNGTLTIDGGDYTLTAKGSSETAIRSNQVLAITGGTVKREGNILAGGGSLTVSGDANVTGTGTLEATRELTINTSGAVSATAIIGSAIKGSSVTIRNGTVTATSGGGGTSTIDADGAITISGGAVTAVNTSDDMSKEPVMYKAPTLGGGMAVLTASENSDGNPAMVYDPSRISTYRYLKIGQAPDGGSPQLDAATGLLTLSDTDPIDSYYDSEGWKWDGSTLTLKEPGSGQQVKAVNFADTITTGAKVVLESDVTLDVSSIKRQPAIYYKGESGTLEIDATGHTLTAKASEDYNNGDYAIQSASDLSVTGGTVDATGMGGITAGFSKDLTVSGGSVTVTASGTPALNSGANLTVSGDASVTAEYTGDNVLSTISALNTIVDTTGTVNSTGPKNGFALGASGKVSLQSGTVTLVNTGTGDYVSKGMIAAASMEVTGATVTFNGQPAFTVSGVSPKSGPTAGGTVVTVTGTNLTGVTGVQVLNTPGTNLADMTATSFTFKTPANEAGTNAQYIVVTNANGSVLLNGAFTYSDAPIPSETITYPGVELRYVQVGDGGYSNSVAPSDGANGNTVTVNNTSEATDPGFVFGGYHNSGASTGNTVTLHNGATVEYTVFGGIAAGGGDATGNTVILNSGSEVLNVSGGWTTGAGSSSGNTVIVHTGAVVNFSVNGGVLSSSDGTTADNNTVILHSGVAVGLDVYGGSRFGTLGIGTGNKLELIGTGQRVGRNLKGFQILDLSLPAATAGGSTVLTVAGTADIDGVAVTLSFDEAPSLNVGDTITLINASNGVLTGVPANSTVTASGYRFRIEVNGESLIATVTDDVATYTATLNIHTDGSPDNSDATSYMLKLDGDEATVYNMTGSGATRTVSVPNGTWKVYGGNIFGGDEYTGVTIVIKDGPASATLDWFSFAYTVTPQGTATAGLMRISINGTPQDEVLIQSLLKGDDVVFTATGSGAVSYTYAWSGTHNGVPISGTGNTYRIPSVQGVVNITCTVTGSDGGGQPQSYNINVINGTSNPTSAAQGNIVTITATAAPDGQRFREWDITPAVTFADGISKTSATAKFTMPDQEVTAEATYEKIPDGITPVTGIALNRSTWSLYSNTTPNTAVLTATVTPADATDKAVTWASGNPSVAAVDQNGNITAVGNGSAVITVTTTDGGYTASCTVTVTTYSSGSTGSGSSGGSSGSTSSQPAGTTAQDPKKGKVNSLSGIITGSGSGYSNWQPETADGTVRWRLQYADGTTAAGTIVTGEDGSTYEQPAWEMVNGAWYPFGADGYVQSGMIYDPALGGYFYIDTNTGMKTGWQLIDGKWYYFNPVSDGKQGIMFADAWIDGWYVDKNGLWNGEQKKE